MNGDSKSSSIRWAIRAFVGLVVVGSVYGLVGAADATLAPPSFGGYDYEVLRNDTFFDDVAPAIDQVGCADTDGKDVGSCHSAGSGGLTWDSADSDETKFANLSQAPFVLLGEDDYEDSRVLRAPLDPAHPASSHLWTSENDPRYQAVLAWIAQGSADQN